MTKSGSSGSIEIEHDLKFQRRSWKVQRVGWVVMLLVVILAVLGVFGNGPLSNASASDGHFLKVDYQRFVRLNSPETLAIDLTRTIGADSTISVWLDREWMRNHRVKSIVPEPRESAVENDKVIYRFATGRSAQPSRIEFDLETSGYGRLRGRAGIVGGPAVAFNQLSYF